MKKVTFLALAILLLSLSLSTAAIKINEVELNPAGADTGNEWVEVYNSDPFPLDISNWTLSDGLASESLIHTFTTPTIIGANNFFVANLSGISLNNGGDFIILRDIFNNTIDMTPNLTDNSNTKTQQRLPDGTGPFFLTDATKNLPNQISLIQNKSSTPECTFNTNNISLSAQLSGFCIQDPIFNVTINDTLELNLTATNISNNYSVTVPSSILTGSQTINWTVTFIDCFSNTTISNGNESLYVNNRTSLQVSPNSPDGIPPWYITEPLFTLSPDPESTKTIYQWDSSDINQYFAPFGLDKIPNPDKKSAGILKLNYWSKFSCGNESSQSQIFHIDLTNPKIIPTSPLNNSVTPSNFLSIISAYLDEIFQSNSGINSSSVTMLLDDNTSLIDLNVTPADTIDATVIKNISPLTPGPHNVTVNATDFSGRSSQLTWFFSITSPNFFNLSVFSPINKSYDTKRIPFQLNTTNVSKIIEYINYNDTRPRFRRLCSNCDKYGFSRIRTKTLREGPNNITIRATDLFGNIMEKNILLFIDSKPPRISKTLPKRNTHTNGSLFEVKYTEDNVKNVTLKINPNFTLSNCTSGRNQICSTTPDLSSFDNQTINYTFEIFDGINSVQSRQQTIFVDTSSPNITINTPLNNSNQTRRTPLNITITEKAFLEYIDLNSSNPRFRRLCSNCDEYGSSRIKTKTFKQGPHEILIKATDKAGNSQTLPLQFTVLP